MDDIKNRLEKLVIDSLKDVLEEYESDCEATPKSQIYGGDSPLDSSAVVSMIVDLESRLKEDFDFQVSITDERAMSQKKSPFGDVPSMVDYLNILYQESQNG